MTTPQDEERRPIPVTGRQGRYGWVPGQEGSRAVPAREAVPPHAVPREAELTEDYAPRAARYPYPERPDSSSEVARWDGSDWKAQLRRRPTRALAVPLVALTGIGVATAWTMWPSAVGGGQAWCSYAEPNASGWATLALWAVGVALALVTFFWWRRDGYTPRAWPRGMLVGALVLPLALGALGWNSCWA